MGTAADPGDSDHLKVFALEEFKHLDEVLNLIDEVPNSYKDLNSREIAEERFKFICDHYQEQPHLLDPHLEVILKRCISLIRNPNTHPDVRHMIFRMMFLIVKTRGYKSVTRLMPHEVADLEPTLKLLSEQSPTDPDTWATTYILLLWLSIVCMIPFDLCRLDAPGRAPVLNRIIDTAKVFLKRSSKPQEAAAYLLAKFHSRPDVVKASLNDFIAWSCAEIRRIQNKEPENVIYLNGLLRCLAHLFKFGKRQDLLPYTHKIMHVVQESAAIPTSNMLVTKLQSKLLQRIGLIFLPVRIATWRYQRGNRSLVHNLAPQASGDRKLGDVGSSYLNHQPPARTKMAMEEDEAEEEEDFDVPDEVAEIIDHLLSALKNRDTIVRWSAAKGIGRLCSRLPSALVNGDVVSADALLSLFSRLEGHASWHGGCLALAELARRGLLLPSRLAEVLPHVMEALIYEERSGDCSLGSNVRDAACYVCWAFARAYDPNELSDHVITIASSLILVSLFDREVNVRRAASAAFQENVGRQGHFPHGIDILTHLDYFAVGNRQSCYMEHCIFIAQFPEYILPMVDHLIDNKLGHWDTAIRELASQALNRLTSFCPDYMLKALPRLLAMCTGTDLYRRHGAILGVAELVLALNKPSDLAGSVEEGIKNITLQLTEWKMFRGLSGELMRRACSTLIERCSRILIPFHRRSYCDTLLDNWSELLDESIQHRDIPVQDAAVSALPHFLTAYYNPGDTERCEIAERYIGTFVSHALDAMSTSNLEDTRRGFCRAIGALPFFVLQRPQRLERLIEGLIACTQPSPRTVKWAESRRLAILALVSVISKAIELMPAALVLQSADAILDTLNDYTVDARGDIGAIVREAGMTCCADLCRTVIERRYDELVSGFFTPERVSRMMCSVAQQAMEKIDRTRGIAGSVFTSLLLGQEKDIPNIPHVEEVREIFQKENCESACWTKPIETFTLFCRMLPLPAYQRSLLLGLTVSVGGLTESTVRHASESLQEILSRISEREGQPAMEAVVDNLIDIYVKHARDERIIVPMMKFLDFLLNRTAVSDCLAQTDSERVERLLHLTKSEITRSREVMKIRAAIDVFCSLLRYPSVIKPSLSTLMILLCHRFPIVRKTSATKIYEALLSYEGVVEDDKLDDAMNFLTETIWEEDLDTIRPIRNNLCQLLGVPVPKIISRTEAKDS